MKIRNCTLAAAFLVTGSLTHAQFSDDFESYTDGQTNSPWGGGFAFSQAGSASETSSVRASIGNPSNAYEVNADFSSASGSFWGAGFAYASVDLDLGGESDLSNITFSFDLYTSELSPVQVILRNGNFGQPAVQSFETNAAVDTWESYSLNLGTDMNPVGGSFDPNGTPVNIVFQINAPWGADAGNIFRVDNVDFTVIPEPQTYALLSGLAALGFLAIRRRA